MFKLGNVEPHHSEGIGILQKYCCSSYIYDSLNDFYFSLDITHLLTLTYKTTVLIFLSTQFLNSFGFIFLFLASEDCKDGTQIIQFFKQRIPVKKYISFKVWNSSRCWAPAMPITWNFTLPLLQLQWWRLEKQKHSANLVAWKWPPLDTESNLVSEECIGSDQEQTRGEIMKKETNTTEKSTLLISKDPLNYLASLLNTYSSDRRNLRRV